MDSPTRRFLTRSWSTVIDARGGRIANSLVFDPDGDPLLVLISGTHRVNTAKVAALVGM